MTSIKRTNREKDEQLGDMAKMMTDIHINLNEEQSKEHMRTKRMR